MHVITAISKSEKRFSGLMQLKKYPNFHDEKKGNARNRINILFSRNNIAFAAYHK